MMTGGERERERGWGGGGVDYSRLSRKYRKNIVEKAIISGGASRCRCSIDEDELDI